MLIISKDNSCVSFQELHPLKDAVYKDLSFVQSTFYTRHQLLPIPLRHKAPLLSPSNPDSCSWQLEYSFIIAAAQPGPALLPDTPFLIEPKYT